MIYRLIKRRDPSVKGVTYNTDIDLSAFAVKKVQFTDSQFRDFMFLLFDETVHVHYLVEPKAIVTLLKVSEIENNIFPPALNDFSEAKNYLVKYFEHVAFI